MDVFEIRSQCEKGVARILPNLGFNCFSLSLAARGEIANVIWSPDGFDTGEVRPSSGGIPILFPFPGRIRDGIYQWEGRSYQLAKNDRKGNAIHGFVFDRPWEIVSSEKDRLKARFQASQQDKQILDLWPADFLIEVEYRFTSASRFESVTTVSNPDDKPLPFGFGLHPYFQIPFAAEQTKADSYQVELPVGEQWVLEELVPNGKRSATDAARFDAGLEFADMQFDDVFSINKRPRGESVSSRIIGPKSGLRYEFDGFEFCVVYTPPTRTAICIEPYSSTPNLFELNEQGIECGLNVLNPGATVEYRTVLELSPRS